jgi:hypothetical protein
MTTMRTKLGGRSLRGLLLAMALVAPMAALARPIAWGVGEGARAPVLAWWAHLMALLARWFGG